MGASHFFGGGGAVAQARNPLRDYEDLTFASGGLGLTNSNGANALSGYTSLSTPANDLSGLFVTMYNNSSTSSRAQLTIRANGSTIIVPDLYIKSDTGDICEVYIPIKVAAGTTLEAAIRTSSNSQTRNLTIEGEIANSTDAPGYTSMTALLVGTAATIAGTVDVPGTDTWTTLIADCGDNYDAFMYAISPNATPTAPTTAQLNHIAIGIGASPSSDYHHMARRFNASEPYIPQALSHVVRKPLLLHDVIKGKITCPASDSVNFRIGLWGFKN